MGKVKTEKIEKIVNAFRNCLMRSLAQLGTDVFVYRVSVSQGGVRGMTEHLEQRKAVVKL